MLATVPDASRASDVRVVGHVLERRRGERPPSLGTLVAPAAVVAIARAAATMVAVAPTLDARSHVSLSVRAIPRPLST